MMYSLLDEMIVDSEKEEEIIFCFEVILSYFEKIFETTLKVAKKNSFQGV